MRKFNTRILSLLMALVMSFSLVITAFAYDIPDGAEPIYGGSDGTEVIGYVDADNHVVWFDNAPYGADDDMTPVDNYTETQPTDDVTFVDEDLALVTKFSDVKTTAWYYSDVTECAKLGIVAGFEDGTFRPEDKVTGVQFITMLTRTFYNSDVETAAKSKPAGSPWYWANTKVASDKYITNGVTVNDNAMNRYDMAQTIYNTLRAQNKAPSTAERNAVQSSIKDYSSVPQNRQIAVKGAYASGIIAGMSDGKFHGEQSMTRAQACTVIMRLLKLINNYNPGDKDNDQYDDGTSQDTGNNNQQTGSGKLANGQDATVANVQAILDQIKREYPTGTRWADRASGNVGNYYVDGPDTYDKTRDVSVAVSKFGPINLNYACGGWMAMVSERIFGKTGAPAREITDITKARPGDIVIRMNSSGTSVGHVGIFLQYVPANTPRPDGVTSSRPTIVTCDGNMGSSTGNGTVDWYYPNNLSNGLSDFGTRYHILTRYPN